MTESILKPSLNRIYSTFFGLSIRVLKSRVVTTHVNCWLYNFLPKIEKYNSFHSVHISFALFQPDNIVDVAAFMGWVLVEVPSHDTGSITRVARRIAKPL